VPSVAAIDNTFGDVTNETTAIETDLVVSNPNPAGSGSTTSRVNYTVSMNDIQMAQGGREGVRVGTGNSTLGLENAAAERGDSAVVGEPRPQRRAHDSRHRCDRDLGPARTERGLLAEPRDPDGSARRLQPDETRPVNADSPLTSDPVLYVNETRGEWGSVSESETPIEMAFTVYNPNIEPYVVTEIGYDITMNGVEMGSGQTDEGYSIPSYSTETVEFTTALQNRHLDDWWVTHLDEEVRGHQVTGLRSSFTP